MEFIREGRLEYNGYLWKETNSSAKMACSIYGRDTWMMEMELSKRKKGCDVGTWVRQCMVDHCKAYGGSPNS